MRRKPQGLTRQPPNRRDLSRLVGRLLPWFRRHGRDLPWRSSRDPYAIWISEVMLQQTQVNTVIPYWQRWIKTLPNINALATVGSEELHKLWEGLGYYSRARNLQKAARAIVDQHQSSMPQRFEDLLALPGVGRYTAGAIASIAFNQPQPVLDGNVIRVLTRYFAIRGNPRDHTVNEPLWQMARQLVELAQRPDPGSDACSQLNQAMMELGALICSPRHPRCGECPVRRYCKAFAAGTMLDYPNTPPRPASRPRRFVALVLEDNGRYWVRQRPGDGVNGHLWEFPNVEVALKTRSLTAAARRIIGEPITEVQPLSVINHSITRYRIALHPYSARILSTAKASLSDARWLTRLQLESLAFTAAHRKILKHLP